MMCKNTLDNYHLFDIGNINIRCRYGLIGNPVKIGSGPAAVIGDDIRNSHCKSGKARMAG